MTAIPDPNGADDLVAQCILVYERDGDAGVDALLASQPALAAEARARFGELRDAGLLLPPTRHPEWIGPYRVLRHLGTGGMGSVFLAEQHEPVARNVAIKLIRPGMDSQEVLARFAVERQALALLDHPHVARIFDAGLTDEGRPFLVMEHVDGVPLLRYCDEHQLPMAARLHLFARICEAVQHAHHKGVIHRDLKPSNILVTSRDGQPWPVVIDFGVAKAVRGRFGARSTVTVPGQLLGTPEYMSPEQARNELDVDTRTDVYSLGVVLYELLTGTLPIQPGRSHRGDQAQLRRLLDESDPPTPSSRITDLGVDGASIADRRATDLSSLQRRLRGDLDWIVLKAIARDRERRYGMPADLAADLLRHLRNEPVLAGPETTRYRLGKFLRRNRLQVGAGAAVAIALVAGLVVSLVFWRTAEASERIAVQQAARAEKNLERALAATKELLSLGDDPLLDLPHMEPVRRQLMEKALVLFHEIEDIDATGDARSRWHVADAQRRVGRLQSQLGSTAAAIANLRGAQQRLQAFPPGEIDEQSHERGLALVALSLTNALRANGEIEATAPLVADAITRLRRLWRDVPEQQGAVADDLRSLLLEALLAEGQYARRFDRPRARELYREADALAAPWRTQATTVAPDYLAQALTVGCEYAAMLTAQGEPAAARQQISAVARDLETLLPRTAPRLQQRRFLAVLQRVADLMFNFEQREEAVVIIERALQIVDDLVREHPDVVTYHVQLVQLRTFLFITRNRMGQNEAASRDYAACIAAAEVMVAKDGSPNRRYQLAYALVHGAYAAMFYQGMGGEVDLVRVSADYARGLAILAELPAELREAHQTRRIESLALHCRAMHRTQLGELDAAIADYEAAAALLDSMVRDEDDVEFKEPSLNLQVLRADLLLRQRRIEEARPVYEMAFTAIHALKGRHSRPDDWRVKERNIRTALARVRGLTGDVAGATELFLTLGHDDNDWIGRDFAGRGLLETCQTLPATDPRRSDLLQHARTVLQASLAKERAQDKADRMVLVMRAGTLLILAELEQESGDWRAAAEAWAGVVEGYSASYEGRPSDRNRERLARAMHGQGKALLRVSDIAAARELGERMAERFRGKANELVAAADLAAGCALGAPGTAEAATDLDVGCERLLAALAVGYRDTKSLQAMPALQPLLADPRVVQALAGVR